MKVTSRELICRHLPALKDNRAEAEELESKLRDARDVNAEALYRPGVYAMMDWVASRLTKAGSAVWAFIFAGDELELISVFGGVEINVLSTVSTYAV
jgi:D-serine deaminase-like pyridoxal phosphate-dependent protein